MRTKVPGGGVAALWSIALCKYWKVIHKLTVVKVEADAVIGKNFTTDLMFAKAHPWKNNGHFHRSEHL